MSKSKLTNGEITGHMMIVGVAMLFLLVLIVGTDRASDITTQYTTTDSNNLRQRLLGNCEYPPSTRLAAIERVIEQEIGIEICGE